MSTDLSSIVSIIVAIATATASAIGGIFAYHKFLMKNLENVRKEFYKEISKLKEDSDKRDDEIKESLKEIKDNLNKRDSEFKESLKEMKNDIKEDLKYIREKVFAN